MSRKGFPIWLAHDAAAGPGERRRAPRAAPFVTRGGLRVEAFGFEVMTLHREAWFDLAGRALESNVFLDPDFALAAAQHAPPARRPRFAVVRGAVEGRMRLLAVCPLAPGQTGLAASARVWTHHYASLGAPALDSAQADAAVAALTAFVAQERPSAGALLFPALAQDGPTAAALRRCAGAAGAQMRVFGAHDRAAMHCSAGAAGPMASKELRRQWRRLSEEGRLDFSVATDPTQVRDGLETFLALETLGWKGKAGTALLQDGGAATFARAALRRMALRGRARIATLSLDGAPIAQGLVLIDGSSAAFWKIAFDPAFARFSPGVQLSLRVSEHLAADATISFVDSCAIEDHPMIGRLWRDRIAIADIAIALPQGRRSFAAAALREQIRRRVRGLAKRAYRAAVRGKAS